MTCVNCAQNIEKSFKNKPHIHSASVNFTLEIGPFEGKVNEPRVIETIEETLESLGHTFTPLMEIKSHETQDHNKDLKTFAHFPFYFPSGSSFFNMGYGKDLASLKASSIIQFILAPRFGFLLASLFKSLGPFYKVWTI